MQDFTIQRTTLAAFAAPAVPLSALGLPLAVFLPPFYVADVGLSSTLVGVIFLAMRLFDLVIDPLFGALADETRSRFGRRRLWLAIGTPVTMLGVFMVFLPPEGAGWLYLVVWLAVLYLGYTMIVISHIAWGAELSGAYHERSRVQGWREFALVGGMIAVLALPAVLEQTGYAGGEARMTAMAVFILVALPVTVALALAAVPERDQPARPAPDLSQWLLVLGNRPLRRLLLADLLQGLAPGITAVTYVFFISDVIGLPGLASALLLVYFVAGLGGIPLWMGAAYRYGKHRALAIAMVWGAVTLPIALVLPAGVALGVVVLNVLYGLSYAAGPFLLRAIMADVTDADTAQSGRERTGVFYALLVMTNKLGAALAVGIVYPMLDLIGFQAGGQNDPDTLFWLTLIFVVLPALCMLGAAWAAWGFPLDEARQRALRDLIDTKRTAADEHG